MNESKKTLTFELNTVTLNVVRLNRDQLVEVMDIDEVNAKLLSIKAGIYIMNLDFIDKVEEE